MPDDRLSSQLFDSKRLQRLRNLVTQFGYDAQGNKTHTVDANGYAAFVDYDSANRKIREYFNVPAEYYSDMNTLNVAATKANPMFKVKTEYE